MSQPLLTATPEEGARETFFRMREKGVRHLPVLDGAQLVGILSDRDLRRPDWVDEAPDLAHDYQLDNNISVSDLMTRHPVSLHTYDSLYKASEIIVARGYGALPILDKGGHLVGIISKHDLIVALHQLLEKERRHS